MTHPFVELALPVDDLLAARAQLLDLGFTELPVTDAWPHAYTALRLGTLSVGLHCCGFIEAPTLVLTRPSLAASIRAASEQTAWTRLQLDEDLFNYAHCDSPSGLGLLLVEATTHASAEPSPIQELQWQALRCTTRTLTSSAAFWAPFANTTSDLSTDPHMSLTFDISGLPLELAETDPSPPLLTFQVLSEAAFVARLAHHGLSLQEAQDTAEFGRFTLRDGLRLAFAY